ncbi:MAG: tRNA pseudouridine(38-40) synthase TruA [candidate division WOR-3 bacterium]
MRNVSLVLAYEGTNYHGWQCQPGVVTVQETLQKAAQTILNHEIKLWAGARTDAGVHAMGQVVNFNTEKLIPSHNLVQGLNSLLPQDIRVVSAADVDERFHARYSARSKVYMYCILNQPTNSPFLARYALHWPHNLDLGLMKRAAQALVGRHDYSAFKKKDEYYRNPVREVTRASLLRRRNIIYFLIEANGFLRYMVRTIVGTLLLVGQGKVTPDEFTSILESRERERAGATVPSQGLFLKQIKY